MLAVRFRLHPTGAETTHAIAVSSVSLYQPRLLLDWSFSDLLTQIESSIVVESCMEESKVWGNAVIALSHSASFSAITNCMNMILLLCIFDADTKMRCWLLFPCGRILFRKIVPSFVHHINNSKRCNASVIVFIGRCAIVLVSKWPDFVLFPWHRSVSWRKNHALGDVFHIWPILAYYVTGRIPVIAQNWVEFSQSRSHTVLLAHFSYCTSISCEYQDYIANQSMKPKLYVAPLPSTSTTCHKPLEQPSCE
jgi:hypothetical protein